MVRLLVTCSQSLEIATLYGDHVTGDIYLKSNDGTVLVAHKSILAANSPTFKRMLFESEHTYKDKERIELDVDFVTLQVLLQHMYTVSVQLFKMPLETKELMSIYDAAVKYELWELADQCILVLAAPEGIERTSASNVCQIWSWAVERDRTTILIDACIRSFISETVSVLACGRYLDWSEEFIMDNFIPSLNKTVEEYGHATPSHAAEAFKLLLLWPKSNLNHNATRIRKYLIQVLEKCNKNWLRAIPSLSLAHEFMLPLLKGTKENEPNINDEGVMLFYQTLTSKFI
jgi:hypothetical protein